MITNWIKIAFRSYRKNLLFTIINILGLTMGMVGIILVTLYWNDELSYNQWNPNKEEVYSVAHEIEMAGRKTYQTMSTVPLGPAVKETFPEVTDFMASRTFPISRLIKTEEKSVFKDGILPTTPNFFQFFPFEFLYGSAENAIKDIQSIAISEDWMKELYGTENPVGKKLTIDGNEYFIRGVYRIPGASSVAPEAVVNMDWNKQMKEYGDNGGIFMFSIFLKIKPGTNIRNLEQKITDQIVFKQSIEVFAKIRNISAKEYIENEGDYKVALDKLSDMRLFAKGNGGAGAVKGDLQILYILTGLSVLILILSAFNYINLTTASSLKRAKEVGIRKALGSSRSRLILQFVFENFILCAFSLLLAMAVAEIILPYFNEYFKTELKFSGSRIYVGLFLILLSVVLLSGLIPSLYLSKFKPLKVLKGNFSRSSTGIWFRNIILGLQFVISAFFLISGMVMYKQVKYMMKKDLGFIGDQVVAVPIYDVDEPEQFPKYQLIKQEFTKIKGVKEISSGLQVPRMYAYMGGHATYNKTGEKIDLALMGAMDYNFPHILNLKILEGRNLSPELASDSISNILVNETLVKQLKIQNPIGEEIFYGPDEKNHKIVGVIKDYIVDGFQSEVMPTVYFHWNTIPFTKQQMQRVLFKIDPEETKEALAEIEKRWKEEIITDGYPFKYDFVDEAFAKSYEKYQNQQRMFSTLTFVAIGIALLGLFGLITFVIEQRMREISVRKVLGASSVNLIRLIGKEYLIIGLISTLITIPLTWYFMQKWLEDFVYRIDMPTLPYVIGVISILILTLIIIGICVKYAMKVSPVKYLKYE
ncbi:MAG: ABC transporter permease [Weeksellaceae bacterium]